MTDNELKKLGRRELLEILLEQSKEADLLRRQLEEANRQLSQRQILIDRAGSIAAASMELNKVFEAAQMAADEYLENVRTLSERQEEICAKMEKDSRREADQILAETREKCQAMEREAMEKCAKMTREAEEQSNRTWEEARKKIQELIDQQAGLRALLGLISGEGQR